MYSLGQKKYSDMVYYYSPAHPLARLRPHTHHPSFLSSVSLQILEAVDAAAAAAAAAALLRLLPLLGLAAASYYHTTPSQSGDGMTVIMPLFRCNCIPQLSNMFFRGYLYNILIISHPYLKLRELFIFAQNNYREAWNLDRNTTLPFRQRK